MMHTYETRLIDLSGDLPALLRRWTRDGWEAVAVSDSRAGGKVLLRRKLPWWRRLWGRATDSDPSSAGRVVYRQ